MQKVSQNKNNIKLILNNDFNKMATQQMTNKIQKYYTKNQIKLKPKKYNKKQIRYNKFMLLSKEAQLLTRRILYLPLSKIIGKHIKSNLEITVKDILTLEDGQWLNDEIINIYMSLLQDRNLKKRQTSNKYFHVLFMNSFFFTKLSSNGYNYKLVKRWTKKIKFIKKGFNNLNNIFELDKFIFPIHVNNIHWCCGCINFTNKRFEYYDSMKGNNAEFFIIIKQYLLDEWKDKLKCDKNKYNLNINEWDEYNTEKYPQQENGFDCGLFTCKCADWLVDDLFPDYKQENMSYFRKRMIVEIIQGKTLDF